MGAPSRAEIDEMLERFRRGPELLAAALTGAAGSEVDFKAAAEAWSVRQIAAHVSDSEIVGAMRYRRIIAEPEPRLEPYDQNAWAEHLDYGRRKPSQSLEMFRRVRAENYELLRELPEAIFARLGNHLERGPVTLFDLVKHNAAHAESHVRQIRTVREQFKVSKATPVS